MALQYFAHSLAKRPKSEWQTLEEHLQAVGEKPVNSRTPFVP